MSARKLNVVLYCRVSNDRRNEQKSVGEQEKELRELARSRGWRVRHVFCDNGVSASRFTRKARPGWNDAKDAIAKGGIDMLVAWDSNRTARDPKETEAFIGIIREQHANVCLGGTVYDPSNADQMMTLRINAVMDAHYSEKLSVAICRGVRGSAEQGKPHGRLPYGYQRQYDPHTGRLLGQVVHPEEGPIYRQCVTGLIDGSMSIADAARAMGSTRSAVRSRMLAPSYRGVREHKGTEYQATWDALITDEEFHALRRMFDAATTGPRRTSNRRHPFTGIYLCGVCHTKMQRGLKSYRNEPGVAIYRCWNVECGKVSIRQSLVDPYVEALLQDAIDAASIGDDESDTAEVAALRVERDSLLAARGDYVEMLKDRTITRAEFADLTADVAAKLDAVEHAIDEAMPKVELDRFIGTVVADCDEEGKRAVAGAFIDSVTIAPRSDFPGIRPTVEQRAKVAWKR